MPGLSVKFLKQGWQDVKNGYEIVRERRAEVWKGIRGTGLVPRR